MKVSIQPGRAVGKVSAPPSKSMAHRLLICAGLAQGTSHIRGVDFNEDILATLDCLRSMGVSCAVDSDTVTVTGAPMSSARPSQRLCCRESGSTLRFFIPLALLCGENVAFTGSEKLLQRPLGVYEQLCRERNLDFSQTSSQLQVRGRLTAGEFYLPGDISSQFITGLLFALPLTQGDSVIHIAPPVESRGYLHLTLQALSYFGVTATWRDACTLEIPGNQRYQAADIAVEGDYSNAAFFAALNILGGEISITGLLPESLQGDKIYQKYFPALAAGCPEIDISDCPDLGPVLFALAAAKNGGVFTGTRRLKIKESDRVAAMAQELAAFGTEVTVTENSVVVCPKTFHRPAAPLQGHNDHRIVMSLAILLTLTGGEIAGAQAITKSFPGFFHQLRQLGIEVYSDETDQ